MMGMTARECMTELESGNRIGLPHWPMGQYLKMLNGDVAVYRNYSLSHSHHSPTDKELDAVEWQVVTVPENIIELDYVPDGKQGKEANRNRVQLHRAKIRNGEPPKKRGFGGNYDRKKHLDAASKGGKARVPKGFAVTGQPVVASMIHLDLDTEEE